MPEGGGAAGVAEFSFLNLAASRLQRFTTSEHPGQCVGEAFSFLLPYYTRIVSIYKHTEILANIKHKRGATKMKGLKTSFS